MRFLHRYRSFWGADPARDVDEELSFHIQMRMDELRRSGVSEDEAREAVMRRFGNVAEIRGECEMLSAERLTSARRADRLDALRQDARFALRTLWANPLYAGMVALTLAIGIGATTAVFSVAYGVLLRPLPFRDAESLVRLWSRNSERGLDFFSVSPADYQVWRAANGVFVGMAAFERQDDATLTRGGEPESVEAAIVTPDVFPLLGTPALHGRALLPEDALPGAPAAAVISHDLWRARLGGDASVIGSELSLDGRRVTVVGVMPPRFSIPGTPAQAWLPLSLAGASDDHGKRYLRVLARLAPGVTRERALARMNTVAASLGRDHPATNAAWSVNMMSVPELIIGTSFRRAVLLLAGVVGFVLLIACSNAANLQLARGSARAREIALRAALGATRGRIVRQLLTESGVLAVAAGVGGVLLAKGGVVLLHRYGAASVPRLDDVRLDAPVLFFTALVAIASVVLFGLLPALRASRADVGETLKSGGRGTSSGLAGHGLRSGLVIAEVSLSLVLLVAAGLLMRSFARLQAVEVGFDPRGVTLIPLRLPETTYPDSARSARFYQELVERVRAIPGVAAADAVSRAPFAGPNSGLVFSRADRPFDDRGQLPDADYRVITPTFTSTLRIPILRGRAFTERDRSDAPAVVLISETLAREYFPGEEPTGKMVRIGGAADSPIHTIVGVVGDARYQSLETPELRPMMYFPVAQRPEGTMAVVARGADAGTLAAALRGILASMDSRLPTPRVSALQEHIGEATATRRFSLVLFGIFAGVALALAALGIYGVMSYLVRQRMHELGIRVALGAPPRALVRSVVGRTLRLALAGVAIGVVGALALGRSLSSLLFEVSATDPLTFAAIALLMVSVAALASAVPARRATRADPIAVLRGD